MARRAYGSIRRLPSGRFQASYYEHRTGERVRAPQTFTTKTEAGAWLSTVEADDVRGELLDQRLSRRLFAEWAAEWLGGLHLKPKTLGNCSGLEVGLMRVSPWDSR